MKINLTGSAVAAIAMFGALILAPTTASAITVYLCFDYADCANCKATYGDNCALATEKLKRPKGTVFDLKEFRHTQPVGIQAQPVNPGFIFDRWGNIKSKKGCETEGGVWDGGTGQGGCTGPRGSQK